MFDDYGLGVMATADSEGRVNTAVYARPHVVGDTTLVWGMTDGRTYRNLVQNPRASYLFRQAGGGFRGARFELELLRFEDGGEMLEVVRRRTGDVVGPAAAAAVRHVAWFRIVERRALI
ncbi:MAG: pyridoxamine 5'-phosphate oxidase family protein [Deltaproteobacteria bacterium]|nr:MAG: pyridoxamine 5'-phosphate oxidase family protein [Deltaproteobacteria bacterium]